MNYEHVLFWTGLDYKQQSYFRSIGIDMMSKDEDIKNIKIDLNKIDLDIFPNLEIFKHFPNAKISGEIVGNYVIGTDIIDENFINIGKKKYEKTVIFEESKNSEGETIYENKTITAVVNVEDLKTLKNVFGIDAIAQVGEMMGYELKKCSENSDNFKSDEQSLCGGSDIEHPSSITLSMYNKKTNNVDINGKNIDIKKVYKRNQKIDKKTRNIITEFVEMFDYTDANNVINAYKHLDFVDTNMSRTIVRDVPNNLYSFGRINNAYSSKYSSNHNLTHYICKTKREIENSKIAISQFVTYQGEDFCVYYFNSEKDCQIFISEINNETFDLLETFESYSQKNANTKQDAHKDIDAQCRHSFQQLIQEYHTCKNFMDYTPFGKKLKIGIVKKTNILWEFSYCYGFAVNCNKGLILRTCAKIGINTKLLVDANGDQQLLIYGTWEDLMFLHSKTKCFKVLHD